MNKIYIILINAFFSVIKKIIMKKKILIITKTIGKREQKIILIRMKNMKVNGKKGK